MKKLMLSVFLCNAGLAMKNTSPETSAKIKQVSQERMNKIRHVKEFFELPAPVTENVGFDDYLLCEFLDTEHFDYAYERNKKELNRNIDIKKKHQEKCYAQKEIDSKRKTDEAIKNQVKKIEELQKIIKNAEQEHSKHFFQQQELESKLQELRQDFSKIKTQNNDYISQLDEKKKELDALREEKTLLEKNKTEETNNMKELFSNKIKDLENIMNGMKEENREKYREQDELKQKIATYERRLEESRNREEGLVKENRALQQRIRELRRLQESPYNPHLRESKIKPELTFVDRNISVSHIPKSLLIQHTKEVIIKHLENKNRSHHPSYAVIENAVKTRIEQGKDSKEIASTIIETIEVFYNTLFERYGFLTEADFAKIVEMTLKENCESFETLCHDYMTKVKNEIERPLHEQLARVYEMHLENNLIQTLNRNAFGTQHLLLSGSQNPEREETWENYKKDLAAFKEKMENLKLSFNRKIKASLEALHKESDAELRGLYSDIFTSNEKEEDIRTVVLTLNEIEGCEDCARIFAWQITGLNKKNEQKKPVIAGSLEDMQKVLYKTLQEKRREIFNTLMKDRNFYPTTNEEKIYGYARINAALASIFGLPKSDAQATHYYKDAGKTYTSGHAKERLINDFFKAYNEKEIMTIAEKVMQSNPEYEKQIKRYAGICASLRKEDFMPKANKDYTEFQSTLYMNRDAKMKRTPLEQIMTDLFGFNEIPN